MKSILLIASFLFLGAFASDLEFYPEDRIDYRLANTYYSVFATPDPNAPPVNCTQAGLTCGTDCQTIYLCMPQGNNFTAIYAGKCDAPETCNNGGCSATPSPECSTAADKSFPCDSLEGMYPDPSDCKKFHYCVPEADKLKEVGSTCGDDWQYNPRTTYCDKRLPNNKCTTYPVPVCKKTGDTAALKDNPSMYYVCLPHPEALDVLYPHLYLCPNGKMYDGKFACK